MIWQRFALGLFLWFNRFSRRGLCSLYRRLCNLLILGKQLQLVHALGFGSEPVPVRPVQLVLKLFNLQGQRLYFGR